MLLSLVHIYDYHAKYATNLVWFVLLVLFLLYIIYLLDLKFISFLSGVRGYKSTFDNLRVCTKAASVFTAKDNFISLIDLFFLIVR